MKDPVYFPMQPVDGRALYTRRGSAAQRGNGEPVLEMSFELDVVALRLSREMTHLSTHLALASNDLVVCWGGLPYLLHAAGSACAMVDC